MFLTISSMSDKGSFGVEGAAAATSTTMRQRGYIKKNLRGVVDDGNRNLINNKDSCDVAMRAREGSNESGCRNVLGYTYNGNGECIMIECECVGWDCDNLFETEEDCEAAYGQCIV